MLQDLALSRFKQIFKTYNYIWLKFTRKLNSLKIDGVAPLITDPSQTSFNILSKKMSGDMWHMTCDMWDVTGGGWWTFSQNVRSLALTIWEWRCFEDIFTKDHWVSELVNDECVCRTSPATPGLLNILLKSYSNI